MPLQNIRISAFGKGLPKKNVTNAFLETVMDTTDEWITSRTGIKERRISTWEDENTAGLCTRAAWEILNARNMIPAEIDLIVVGTISPDYLTPSTACMVQGNLGAQNAMAFDVNAACSGFIIALRTAWTYLKSGVYKNALVLGGDVMSKLVDWQDRKTCVLFGDGAGGVLLEAGDFPRDCFGYWDVHSDGSRGGSLTAYPLIATDPFGGERGLPRQAQGVSMDGRRIFDFAVKTIPQSIHTVLEKSETALDEVKYIVPHQANARITAAIAKKMGISEDRFYMNIAAYGNTTAGTIPIALAEMYEKGLIQPENGDKIILTGFGGGLTWGSTLLTI